MILFQCPNCGAVHRVDAQYAGGVMECPSCGQQITIPRETDPSCVLVYKAGESEDGIPMHLDTVRLQLVSGELSDTELIWDNSTWRPLGEFLGMEGGPPAAIEDEEIPEGVPVGLALAEDDVAESDGESELAESLDDLTPIKQEKKNKGKKQPAETPQKKRRSKIAFWKRNKDADQAESGDAEQDADADEKSKKKRGGRLYYAIQAVLGILALTVGYKLGFGPLIAKAQGKPSFIIVQNHEPYEFIARLGWRRVRKELYNNSMCSYEIYVGMNEKQTLTLTPKEEGKGERYKVKVPIRRGGTIIVNVKQQGDYGIFDPSIVRSKKIAAADMARLKKEISGFNAPQSIAKISRSMQDMVRPAFKGTKNDLFFSDVQYDLQNIPIYDRPKTDKKKEEKEKKPPVKKDMVVFPPIRRLNFAEGYSVYDHTNQDRVERGVYVDAKTVELSKTRKLNVGRILIEIRGDKNKLSLSARKSDALTHSGTKFTGEWKYSATMALSGKYKGIWRHQWQFSGNGSLKGKAHRLVLTVQPGGKETEKITEVR